MTNTVICRSCQSKLGFVFLGATTIFALLFGGPNPALADFVGATPLTAPGNGDPPIVEYTTTSIGNDTRPFTLGFEFLTSVPFTVQALGYWNDGAGYSHDVGLWTAGGTLITSTTVLSSDPAVGHFLYQSITPFVLAPGIYVIGGQTYEGGNRYNIPIDASGITSQPGYFWLEDRQQLGSGLNYPTLTTGGTNNPNGYGQNGLFMVDLFVAGAATVPEPSTLTLLGIGAVCSLGFGWRRRGQRL